MKKNVYIGIILIVISIIYFFTDYNYRLLDIISGIFICLGILLIVFRDFSSDTEKLLLALIPAIFAIIGLILGNYITHFNSEQFYLVRHIHELQEESYSKIMGLKLPFAQSLQRNLECKVLAEFY